jgi:hypothetical protein
MSRTDWLRGNSVYTLFEGLSPLIFPGHFRHSLRIRLGTVLFQNRVFTMEVTKALAALQPLYGKGNVEIITRDGVRVRGIVRSMKTTQALTTPSVKVERADGQIVKVPFTLISEIIDHNPVVSR